MLQRRFVLFVSPVPKILGWWVKDNADFLMCGDNSTENKGMKHRPACTGELEMSF